MNTPEFEIDAERLRVAATLLVAHRPDAVRLDSFPLLVYSPIHHEREVATEDNQTPIGLIALAAAEIPDVERLARKFKTTPAHVIQALDYACKLAAD